MFKKIQKIIEENWKIPLTLVIGMVLGGFVFGKIINGFSIINGQGGIGISINRNPLPDYLDVTGEWVYVAETNDKDIRFSEDTCRKRFGTVYIVQKTGSYEVSLAGERKIKEDCSDANGAKSDQVIRWNSENAAVLANESKIFLWLKTEDEISRYGYISATIIKDSNGIKPTKLQGDMYYLEDANKNNKKWFRAKIDFYKSGSQDAKNIEKKW